MDIFRGLFSTFHILIIVISNLIILFLAALGLLCSAWTFSSFGAQTSPVVECGLWSPG